MRGLKKRYQIALFSFSLLLVLPFFASAQNGELWEVGGHVWNENLNLYATTHHNESASLLVNKVESEGGSVHEGRCDEWDTGVIYVHDSKHEFFAEGVGVEGKLIRTACSPVYGEIYFSPAWPQSDDACHGLTGNDRQARIEKVGNELLVSGCAYVPLLKDFIWLGKAEPEGYVGTWDDTRYGLHAEAKTSTTSASISLTGCAWSKKHGDWSFGKSGDEGCSNTPENNWALPKANIKYPFGDDVTPEIRLRIPSSPTVRFGQRVVYDFFCSSGYAGVGDGVGNVKVTREGDSDSKDISSEVKKFSYEEVIIRSIREVLLRCGDARGFFELPTNWASLPGVVIESVLIGGFTASPDVLAEAGLVNLEATIRNFDPLGTEVKCKIINKNKTESNDILDFAVESLRECKRVPDVVVQETTYELICEYCGSGESGIVGELITCGGDKPAVRRSSPARVTVKLFPDLLLEEKLALSDSIPFPTAEVDSHDISFTFPDKENPGDPEVTGIYVYLIDDSPANRSVGEESLYKIIAKEGHEDNYPQDKVTVNENIPLRDVGDKMVVAEHWTDVGLRSARKVIHSSHPSSDC